MRERMGVGGWQFRFEAPPAWRILTETFEQDRERKEMYTYGNRPKAFRAYTTTIPLADKTVVMHDSEGFANTTREKLSMLRNTKDAYIYVAWPGKFETHIFRGTPADVLAALVEKVLLANGDEK